MLRVAIVPERPLVLVLATEQAGPALTGLKIDFQIRDEKMVVEGPLGVNIPTGTPDSQRIIEGRAIPSISCREVFRRTA